MATGGSFAPFNRGYVDDDASASCSGGSGNGGGGGGTISKAFACDACRVAKRRCEGNYPCDRCVRLNYQCVEPGQRGEGQQAAFQVILEVFAPTPLDSAVCEMDAAAVMEAAGFIMETMAREGLLVRQTVVHQLRGWAALCGAMRGDMTRGLYDRVRTVMEIPAIDVYIRPLEDINLLALPGESDADRLQRRRRLHVRRLGLISETFVTTKTFSDENDEYIATYMILYDGAGPCVAVNKAFEESFVPAKHLLSMILDCGLAPEFVPLAFIEGNGRIAFLQLLFSVLFHSHTSHHHPTFVRMMDNEGRISARCIEIKSIVINDGRRGVVVYLHKARFEEGMRPEFYEEVTVAHDGRGSSSGTSTSHNNAAAAHHAAAAAAGAAAAAVGEGAWATAAGQMQGGTSGHGKSGHELNTHAQARLPLLVAAAPSPIHGPDAAAPFAAAAASSTSLCRKAAAGAVGLGLLPLSIPEEVGEGNPSLYTPACEDLRENCCWPVPIMPGCMLEEVFEG